MRFLFCCEFYYPSVGGVQEVMRQIAERLVRRGHQVTVATSRLKAGMVDEYNGVHIEHFAVSGNEARGMVGEINRYREFVTGFAADAILIKAAQQWTFDALFPVLDRIAARKLFIPCGFSGMYEPLYKNYFAKLPDILRQFDRLVFYAERYRDIDFCRAQGLQNLSFIPNGASEIEFADKEEPPDFRQRLGIKPESFVFSTVGSMTGVKGHREVAEAFARMDTGGLPVTLVLNGNQNAVPSVPAGDAGLVARVLGLIRREGIYRTLRRCGGLVLRFVRKRGDLLAKSVRIAQADPAKQVLMLDLPRADVVNLFKTTDLFVFASNIEYSPLVLFEAAAAGTPFLTVPVGNAQEIAEMTGAGVMCPAPRDTYGYTRADPQDLAEAMARLMNDKAQLDKLGQAGRHHWEEKFTWDKIAARYEAVLTGSDDQVFAAASEVAVSVLLPVFNGGVLLEQAVRSILAQTMSDFELLILDDGSSDGAVEKLAALDDARVRIIGDKARRGLSARLNQGIDAARGRTIARMDADDIALPQRFEKQLQFLDAHPEIDLVGSRAAVIQDENVIGLLPFAAQHEGLCARLWRGIPLPHPTWMGRAAWFRRFRYAWPEVARAEDQELLLRSHAESRFACLEDVLLIYRQGKFNFGKTFIARRHLFAAQQGYFLRHHQWKFAVLNILMTAAKILVDLAASVPGCEALFFARMAAPVPQAVTDELKRMQGRS